MLLVVAMVAWLLLTTTWLSWSSQFRASGDSQSYIRMARAAPGLPSSSIGSAYTDRFVPHYAVGLTSRALGVQVEVVYCAFSGVVLLGVVLVARAILLRLVAPRWPVSLGLAVLLLNPYFFRTYLPFPALYADPLFVLGLAVAILGLVDRRLVILGLGVVIAVLARQTALLAVPPLAIWVWCDRTWDLTRRTRVVTALGLVVVPWLGHRAIRQVTAPFTAQFEPRIPQDTVLPLVLHPSGHVSPLVIHVARTFLPLLVALALLAVGWAVGRRTRRGWSSPHALGAGVLLVVSAAIVAQPLLISPDFPGLATNEQRLSALAVLTLALAVALFSSEPLRATRVRGGTMLDRAGVALFLVSMLISSLRAESTVIGPASKAAVIAVQLVCALIAAGSLWCMSRSGQRPAVSPATGSLPPRRGTRWRSRR